MEENLETYKAPEHLIKFFNKLTDLKEFIKKKHEETNDPNIKEIFDRLHTIFKTTKETIK